MDNPAFVLHNQEGFKPTWFDSSVPTLYTGSNFNVLQNDIVVIPEGQGMALEALKNINVRKYVFCQNHYYVFRGLQNCNTWSDYGISNIICSSDIISEFVRNVFGYDNVPVIHYAINHEIFKPKKKTLQIAYMPRKRPFELGFIRDLFNRIYKQYEHVPWICIDNLNETKVAEVLCESAIFLSSSIYEGFGLPPIEAMACGCVVVGFHGDGGLEYVTSDNGFWCEGEDIIECAKTLGRVISMIEKKDKIIDKVRGPSSKKGG